MKKSGQRPNLPSGHLGSLIAAVVSLTVFVLFMIPAADSVGRRSVVYADDMRSETFAAGEAHALWGMAQSVRSLEDYYIAGQTRYVSGASSEVLAGTRSVNRNAVNRNAFYQELSKAAELGYDAMVAITENQMPYNEYYTLLQIVEAEATGGDVESKMMVANVVLNRVNDPHFPDTISEVVWQRIDGTAQFSPTMDGRIGTVTITSSTIEAVDRALNGEDNSQGALFFLARASSATHNVQWFENTLVRLFEYGGHEYFTYREYAEGGDDSGAGSGELFAEDASEDVSAVTGTEENDSGSI